VSAAVGATAAGALGGRLFADFAASLGAGIGTGHCLETLTFARTLAFAGVVLGFAVVLAFARVDAVAVNGGVSGLSLSDNTGKHSGSGHCESGTSSSGFDVQCCIPHDRRGVGLNGLFSLDTPLE